jgi:D-cysteine desulfhydrase family pyridoxal phosphate-dependent enzyme
MRNAILNRKVDLGFFPTPVQELKRLSASFPGYRIYIKRDDQSGLATGGNKTRKLEYLLWEALDQGGDTVITAGAQQSNHCRQTAAACAALGLECHLLLGGEQPEHYEGNLLLSSLLGAHIHFCGDNRKGEDIPEVKKNLESLGKSCFVVPYGGSNLTGCLGFISALKELKDQQDQMEQKIDFIFFASSSGGTQAGLMLGVDLFGMDAALMPVSIDKEQQEGKRLEELVLLLIREGAEILDMEKAYDLETVPLIRDYDQAGYGVLTDEESSAIHLLAQKEGILLDPVYTGRAFFGMLDQLRKGKIPKNSNVLFWHTGGIPALFQ